jgi:hypothetical protein
MARVKWSVDFAGTIGTTTFVVTANAVIGAEQYELRPNETDVILWHPIYNGNMKFTNF